MVSALLLLLSVAISFRGYSLLRANIWIVQHGEAYQTDRDEFPETMTGEQRHTLFVNHRGDFFPFGCKATRLKNAARTSESRIRGLALWAFYCLWFYPVACCAFSCCLVSFAWQQPSTTDPQFTLALICAGLLLLNLLFLCSEAALSFVKMHSWGRAYHGSVSPRSRSISELIAAGGAGLVLLISSWASLFLVARTNEGAFGKLPAASFWDLLGNCFYYTWKTATQSDADPLTAPAKTFTQLIALAGLIYVVAVAPSVLAVTFNQVRARSAPDPAPPRPEPKQTSRVLRSSPNRPAPTRKRSPQSRSSGRRRP
jgi:hypothetical protein